MRSSDGPDCLPRCRSDPRHAADQIAVELNQAGKALRAENLDAALDGYACALDLALQLGPAPTGQVLHTILQGARELALRQDADGLSTLGPTLVGLVSQVRETGALPATEVMAAWAAVAAGLGALIGQVGLVLALAPGHREGLLSNARAHAALLDDATGGLFALAAWLDELRPG